MTQVAPAHAHVVRNLAQGKVSDHEKQGTQYPELRQEFPW